MKLKFPKKIIIGDTVFKIRLDSKTSAASFFYYDQNNVKAIEGGEIKIGTYLLKVNPIRVFSEIIHELKEIIQVEQGARLRDPSVTENYEFHYNHKQHTDLCSRLAGLLNEFIK